MGGKKGQEIHGEQVEHNDRKERDGTRRGDQGTNASRGPGMIKGDIEGDGGGGTIPGRGPGDEKGDKRRNKPRHSGPTRPGASSRGRSGSDSNAESDK